ncbi:MAG: ferrochelatase [Verrucomicrobiales bacterium]|nr:ferrochelatase [Verrucomicrobiales bacterium]
MGADVPTIRTFHLRSRSRRSQTAPFASIAPGTELIVHPPFYAAHEYITALATVTKTHLPKDFDHLLFSFHSLPERHLRKADPTRAHCLVKPDCCHAPSPAHATCYKHQCLKTMEAVVEKLGLPPSKCSIAFQSQFGPGRWLGPGTMAELRRLAMAGAKKVAVICPSFVADCVETLEEIGMRARAEFMAAGGREFVLIPCLNDHVSWVRALAVMITQAVNQRTAT